MKTDICAQVDCFIAAKKFGQAKRQLLTRKKKVLQLETQTEIILLMKPIRGQRSYYFADTLKPITASDMPPQVPQLEDTLCGCFLEIKPVLTMGGESACKIEIFF